MSRLTADAALLAHAAHQGQVDKIGAPYIEHPCRIARAVHDAGAGDQAEQVAWLHDVVEDTEITLDDLRDQGYDPAVIEAVDAVTKRKGEKFADYYERVKANPLALVVKWHDVQDNARPDRLAKVAPDTRERLRDKYERALALLSSNVPEPVIARIGHRLVVSEQLLQDAAGFQGIFGRSLRPIEGPPLTTSPSDVPEQP